MTFDYSDIHSSEPYYEIEIETKRALLHVMYVPPEIRYSGEGKRLFRKIVDELPEHVEYIRLKSASLGSGCTLNYWLALGFEKAYCDCDPNDEGLILHYATNGNDLPAVVSLANGEERHYIFDD